MCTESAVADKDREVIMIEEDTEMKRQNFMNNNFLTYLCSKDSCIIKEKENYKRFYLFKQFCILLFKKYS